MHNAISKLPNENPDFFKKNQEERRLIVEEFIGEYENLVTKRTDSSLNRSERMDIADLQDKYWSAWKENFRTKKVEDYFDSATYRSLSFRFYALSGKKGYKDAHEFCIEMLDKDQISAATWYYFADLQYRFGDASTEVDEAVVSEMFGYYANGVSAAVWKVAKAAAVAAAAWYMRHLRELVTEGALDLESISNKFLGEWWMDGYSETLFSTEPILSNEILKSTDTVWEESGPPNSLDSLHFDETMDWARRLFEERWKDLSVAVITTDKGVRLIKDMKRDGSFKSLGLMNDSWISAFDAWKEKNRSIFDFLTYDLILVGENDHVFRDMGSSWKGAAVTTFLKENSVWRQVILDLRRGTKTPKTDRSVIVDKIDEAKKIYLEMTMKEVWYEF